MAKREALLDSEWLLGSTERSGRTSVRFFVRIVAALSVIAIGVILWPTLSRAWVQQQLTNQFQNGSSSEERTRAMVMLAEMLPESLPTIVDALGRKEAAEAHLSYEALDYYIGQLVTLSTEKRRGPFAELVHAIEQIVPRLNQDSRQLAIALAARVRAIQQSDAHPGSMITLAACQRIAEGKPSLIAAMTASHQKLADSSYSIDSNEVSRHLPVMARLSDRNEQETPESTESLGENLATVDHASNAAQPLALPRMELTAQESSAIDSSDAGSVSVTSGNLRERLRRANRFVAASGNTTFSVQSNTLQPLEETPPSPAKPSPTASSLATDSVNVSSPEEVIGISRWETENLIRLLSSVTPRLAAAAFHELRNRLSPKELELAVELAQGTSEQRIHALERVAKDPTLNPIAWLAWMGSDADREVRMKAVSLLGSINDDDARRKLRSMHGRERDAEISRQIQAVLLASGATKSMVR